MSHTVPAHFENIAVGYPIKMNSGGRMPRKLQNHPKYDRASRGRGHLLLDHPSCLFAIAAPCFLDLNVETSISQSDVMRDVVNLSSEELLSTITPGHKSFGEAVMVVANEGANKS